MPDQLEERVRREIEAVWRIEAPKLIGALTHLTNDLGDAEELAQDALVAALEQWPTDGIPNKPGAWLLTTARRRGIDRIRRHENLQSKYQLIGEAVRERNAELDLIETIDHIEDDMLRLVFIACHPSLPVDGRIALALRVLGGLSVKEIAAAFLVSETTMAARITRAKKTLRSSHAEFVLPDTEEQHKRLPDVLEVVYLIFNEGYSASSGDDWMRPQLTEEAIRLGRVLAALMPNESEVHGLVALMHLQASRAAARIDSEGMPVLLPDQNRRRWNRTHISLGNASLATAYQAGDAIGTYTLQASIAACHARARRAQDTDWHAIVAYYDLLRIASPSPIVDLNRAVAIGKAQGAQAGLDAVEEISRDKRLADYHLLPSTRAHFLGELGRNREAIGQYQAARELTTNESTRRLIDTQIALLSGS